MLIDLGETTDLREPDLDRERPGRTGLDRRPRIGALLLLVLLLVAGAAPSGPETTGVRPSGTVPIAVGGTFAITSDLLLVSEPDGTAATLTGYAVPGGRPRWRVPMSGVMAFTAIRAGDLVLLTEFGSYGQRLRTVARSAASGVLRWSRPGRVLTSTDLATGFAVNEVRSVAGPARRVEGPVIAVDLATGSPRWDITVTGTAVVAPVVSGAPGVLVVHDTGEAQVLDAGTGAAVGSVRLPPTDYAPDNPAVVGDRLILRHRVDGVPTVSSYELPGLRRTWSAPADDGLGDVRSCGRLACLLSGVGIRAVDPSTGVTRWQVAATGWRTVSRRGGGEIATRPDAEQRRLLVGVLDDRGGRVVGVLPPAAVDCRAHQPLLVCRTGDDHLGVWRIGRP
ncbi:PQQ-binding-like beta-propeller repeat protein [Plantactinospora sp. GCM10030261]|uniref:outer membrane protein assembly factor BamB family protein n=1 Tax=Plantactinospora sp. GCM10030261 TaxID=3273420 RepID=UPI003613AE92